MEPFEVARGAHFEDRCPRGLGDQRKLKNYLNGIPKINPHKCASLKERYETWPSTLTQWRLLLVVSLSLVPYSYARPLNRILD